MRVLNFGSLNLDYVYAVDHFVRPGETLSSASRAVKHGGKGLNQSIALARAGARVSHAGCLGEGGEPVDCRIADSSRDGKAFEDARQALGDLAESEEDVMSYICFPDQAMDYLKQRKQKRENIVRYSIEPMEEA